MTDFLGRGRLWMVRIEVLVITSANQNLVFTWSLNELGVMGLSRESSELWHRLRQSKLSDLVKLTYEHVNSMHVIGLVLAEISE